VKPRKPLPRRTAYIGRSPIKRGPRRSRFPKLVNEAFREYVREQPCILVGHPWGHNCWGSVQCCHVKARGAGGADVGNCVPMCASAHALQHVFGMKSFQKTFKLDLPVLAAELGDRWRADHAEEQPNVQSPRFGARGRISRLLSKVADTGAAMSLCRNGAIRCDWCGKLSGHTRGITAPGEYLKADGLSVGYIRAANRDEQGNALDDKDICDECNAKRASHE
jgi:hypothetical protein